MLHFLKDLLSHWKEIVALIIGIYEVIARVIPTAKDITIFGKLIAILKYVSDFLNVEKK
jgi:hypothetical protein